MCTDFEMLKVKVPIIFLGTVGFSLRRDGRYKFEADVIGSSQCGSFGKCDSFGIVAGLGSVVSLGNKAAVAALGFKSEASSYVHKYSSNIVCTVQYLAISFLEIIKLKQFSPSYSRVRFFAVYIYWSRKHISKS